MKRIVNYLSIKKEEKFPGDVLYQEFFTSKGIFAERYFLPNKKVSTEILMYVGLNILPNTKYFGYFPYNLCKDTNSNVSVVYEPGCSSVINRYFRRFTQKEAEEQFLAGFEVVKNFKGKVIIFSHSASTIEHLKLIFNDKYKNFYGGINIAGGIVSSTVTNVLQELKKVWPSRKVLNWRNIMRLGRFFDIPVPIYPYFNKAVHARYSAMNNLSIWINAKTSEFLLNTNIKNILINGKSANYPLLVVIGRKDVLFSPRRQETLARYMSKKAKVDILKCDGEHNIFLSNDNHRILERISIYIHKIISGKC